MTSRTLGGALSTELRELMESTVKMTLVSMSSRSSVDRAPSRYSGRYGFNFRRSCHVDQFTFTILIVSTCKYCCLKLASDGGPGLSIRTVIKFPFAKLC